MPPEEEEVYYKYHQQHQYGGATEADAEMEALVDDRYPMEPFPHDGVQARMLSETEAFALLEHYCAPLRDSKWTNADFDRGHGYFNVAFEEADFVVPAATATSTTHARFLGARLRLAFGVAQAVSCCRGFDPETNRGFWRHVVATLLSSENSRTGKLVLSRTTFRHVGMAWHLTSRADDTFWVGFFYGTPASDAVLAAVLHKLRPHVEVEPLPPLRVALSHCAANDTVPTPTQLPLHPNGETEIPRGVVPHPYVAPHVAWSIVRAAQISPVTTMWSHAPCHVGLDIHFRVGLGASTMRHTLALLRRGVPHAHLQLSVDRLTIELTPLNEPRVAEPGARSRRALVSRARPLGELLRGLLVARDDTMPRVRTVALTGCPDSDYRHVGAALSAVALASPPAVELRCRGLFGCTERRGHVLRLAWLAFALHRRSLSTLAPLKLALLSTGVAIDESERAYITQLLALGTPLRDVVGETLRLRLGGDDSRLVRLQVECGRLGSTVRLAHDTRLYFEPFRCDDDENECVAIVTDSGEDEILDLVAHVADEVEEAFVGVVYAGFGLVWASGASVVSWHRCDYDVIMVDTDQARSEGLALASLALGFEGTDALPSASAPVAFRVTALLPLLLGGALTTLRLEAVILPRVDLAVILDGCPRLQSLNLDCCVVESLDPLVDAYRRGTTAVSTLSLLDVRGLQFLQISADKYGRLGSDLMCTCGDPPDWLASFVDALVRGLGRPTLRELRLDIHGIPAERDLLARLVLALETGAMQLARLHVSFTWALEDAMGEAFGALRDAVARDPPRVRCAVLSVLRAFGCETTEVTRTVLALVEGGVTRAITWNY